MLPASASAAPETVFEGVAGTERIVVAMTEDTDLSVHSPDAIAAVAATLNARPRKTLGWKTPAEALDECLLQINKHPVATTG